MRQEVKIQVTLVGGPLCGLEDLVPLGPAEQEVYLFRCRETRRVYAYEFTGSSTATGLWVLRFFREVGGPLT